MIYLTAARYRWRHHAPHTSAVSRQRRRDAGTQQATAEAVTSADGTNSGFEFQGCQSWTRRGLGRGQYPSPDTAAGHGPADAGLNTSSQTIMERFCGPPRNEQTPQRLHRTRYN
ncbi:unnamed protein product [Gadus morhua 'NCC']